IDIITLILAVWGAVLSTILGIRELRKDKRSLKIILEHVNWMETKRLVIINTGLRPITIDQVFISVNIKNHGPYDAMPKKAFWSDAEDHKPPRLPFTLEDGRMAVFYVSEFVNEQLRLENSFLKIQVYDAEGNIYTKYRSEEHTSELQSLTNIVCRLLLEKKKL